MSPSLGGQCLNATWPSLGGQCLNVMWPTMGGQCINATRFLTNRIRFEQVEWVVSCGGHYGDYIYIIFIKVLKKIQQTLFFQFLQI